MADPALSTLLPAHRDEENVRLLLAPKPGLD
jgi:hypothetical protein